MSYLKKHIIILLVLLVIPFIYYCPAYGQIIPVKQLVEVENILYGAPLDLSIIERIEQVELTLYDQTREGSIKERADRIISFVLPTEDEPSLIFLINTLEWTLNNKVCQGDIVQRLDGLERLVFGKIQSGSLEERFNRLKELSFSAGELPVNQVEIPGSTEVNVRILSEINSAKTKKGQMIDFEVTRDIKVGDVLVIPGGAAGVLEVAEVDKSGKFGKKGQVELKLSKIQAIDGTFVTVDFIKGDEDNKSCDMAVGAGLLGTIIIQNPIGLAVGYFVEGKDEVIPTGTELNLQTVQVEKVIGLNLQ